MNRSSSQFLKLFEIILQRKSMYIFMASVCYAFTMDMLLFSGESILYSLDSLGISMYFGHEFYSVTEYDDKLFWKSKVFLWVEKKKKKTLLRENIADMMAWKSSSIIGGVEMFVWNSLNIPLGCPFAFLSMFQTLMGLFWSMWIAKTKSKYHLIISNMLHSIQRRWIVAAFHFGEKMIMKSDWIDRLFEYWLYFDVWQRVAHEKDDRIREAI